MRLYRILRDRLCALAGRDRVASEIRDELQFHLDMRIEEHLRRGLTRDEAERAARQQVGNLALLQDRGYDIRGGGVMESIIQDLRYGVRLLWKQRGFSAVAIVTLALGIGATTAIFSVVDAAILRPLPYPHPEQLVRIALTNPKAPTRRISPSIFDMEDWRALTRVFAQVAAFKNESVVVVDGVDSARFEAQLIDADYLSLYGVSPAVGRGFSAEDLALNAPPVIMIGFGYWQRRYGGDAGVVGQSIRLATGQATIIGVLPRGFSTNTAIWRPLQLTAAAKASRQYPVYGRLQPGVSLAGAQQELNTLAARLATERPDRPGFGASLQSMYDTTTAGYRPTIVILASAVGFVLLIACVNVASLQLARGATRQHELAIRASIGAGRGRLVRQLLTESVVLALAGSVGGVLVAWSTLTTLVANIPIYWSSDAPVELNWLVLGFTLALAIVSGVLFGLLPAFRLSRVRVGDVLARVPRGHGTAMPRRLSQTLVAIEVALAVVLLAGGGLMIRSFAKLTATDLGFRPAGFLTMEVEPIDPSPASYMSYYPALLERLRALPDVGAAGAVTELPLSGSFAVGMIGVPGQAPPSDRQGVNLRQVLPGYFEAIGLPLRAGRLPQSTDNTSAPIVVINDQAAQQLFPGVSPLGHHLEISQQSREIVGVVGDVRHGGPQDPPVSEVYLLYAQGYTQTTLAGQAQGKALTIVVRPRADTPGLAVALRQAALDVGPQAIVLRIRRGEDWFGQAVTRPRQRTVLLGLLGGLGLLLAVVGVFGVTSYMVARRTQEIGVRMAFGARPRDVVRTMVGDSAWPIGLGILAGLAGAAAATRVIASFLFDTAPTDPVTFAGVAASLALAGGLAAWIPSRRAARVDPVAALRAD